MPVTRLLVVDDDPNTRSLIIATLKQHGRVIHEADNAIDALHLARQTNPHILILDLGLPGLYDGFNLLEALEKEAQFRKLHVLIESGWSDEEDLLRAKRLGADAFIIKPFLPSQLLQTVALIEKRIENIIVITP